MFTKAPGIRTTWVASAAMLALVGGCASNQSKPMQTASSRNDGYRTMPPSVPNTQARTESSAQGGDFRTAPDSRIGGEPGPETAALRQNRVTVISAKEPPATPVETPSHTPNDNEFWIGGNWVADANGFSWRAGRVEHYRPGELFVRAGWAASPQGWEFTPEYWR